MSISVRNLSAFVASLDPAQRRFFVDLEAERCEVIQHTIDYLNEVVAQLSVTADLPPDGETLFHPLHFRDPRDRLLKLRFDMNQARWEAAKPPAADTFSVDLDEVHAWACRVCAMPEQPDYNDAVLKEMTMLRGQARPVALHCRCHPEDPRSETILRALSIVTLPEAPGNNALAQMMFSGRWGWLKRELDGL